MRGFQERGVLFQSFMARGAESYNLLLAIYGTEEHTAHAWERSPQMAIAPEQQHILLDLTCPHCHRMNLLAVVPAPGATSYVECAAECAHCKKTWEASIPGTVVGGAVSQ